VESELIEGMLLAWRYLVSVGHKRVALMSRRRVLDATAFHNTSSSTVTFAQWLMVADRTSDIERLCSEVIAAVDRPTAIICDSDAMASHVIRLCDQAGVEVPGAMSVIGFGDSDEARGATPRITSVRCTTSEFGEDAAEQILTQLGKISQPSTSGIPRRVQLVIRASTAAIPA
jgi:DNA-binding LacI/PurR family transcriptional regulator